MSNLYDVYEPISQTCKPATKRQREVLELMRSGSELTGHFDVYGGYWWTQEDFAIDKRTVQGLLDRRLIEKLPTERVYSGRQRTPFRVSEKAGMSK